MNNAAMNISVQVVVWTYFFISFGSIPGSGIAGNSRLYHFPSPPTLYEGMSHAGEKDRMWVSNQIGMLVLHEG